MRERDTIGPLQRSKALERDDALDGWRRPRRPQGEPVLFWAERAPAFYLRATAISALLMAPMVFFAPGIFLAFLGVLVLSNWLNARLFRFEVGPRTLSLRQSLLLPRITIPLAQIAAAEAREDAPGGAGLLILKLKDGHTLGVPGLKEVREAAQAIRTIQSGGTGPAEAA